MCIFIYICSRQHHKNIFGYNKKINLEDSLTQKWEWLSYFTTRWRCCTSFSTCSSNSKALHLFHTLMIRFVQMIVFVIYLNRFVCCFLKYLNICWFKSKQTSFSTKLHWKISLFGLKAINDKMHIPKMTTRIYLRQLFTCRTLNPSCTNMHRHVYLLLHLLIHISHKCYVFTLFYYRLFLSLFLFVIFPPFIHRRNSWNPGEQGGRGCMF